MKLRSLFLPILLVKEGMMQKEVHGDHPTSFFFFAKPEKYVDK